MVLPPRTVLIAPQRPIPLSPRLQAGEPMEPRSSPSYHKIGRILVSPFDAGRPKRVISPCSNESHFPRLGQIVKPASRDFALTFRPIPPIETIEGQIVPYSSRVLVQPASSDKRYAGFSHDRRAVTLQEPLGDRRRAIGAAPPFSGKRFSATLTARLQLIPAVGTGEEIGRDWPLAARAGLGVGRGLAGRPGPSRPLDDLNYKIYG